MTRPPANCQQTTMPSKPAVLIAAYNADKTIERAVDSVLSSTVPCHIYIVDDGSRVPVRNILGRRAGEIEIIRLEKNRGPAAARNIGLSVILERDHDFVAILDADDAA